MKNYIIILLLFMGFAACEIDDQADPNAPSLNSVLTDASQTELNLLVNGITSSMRNGYGTYVTSSGTVAREFYTFDADPRNTEDLLGKDGVSLDNNTFYITAPFNTRYRTIKNANILLDALDNTSSVSEQVKQGYRGFAKTIQSLMYWQVLNMLDENGIRIDVRDPENLGPFVSKSEAQAAIIALVNSANQDLNGSTFAFQLPSGFTGFDTPQSFQLFNRALLARYQNSFGDYNGALSTLASSFMDKNGALSAGPNMTFSTGSGDQTNPVFRQAGQNGDQIVVHNQVIADLLDGDARASKFALRLDPTSQDGLTGTHETALYASPNSPISIIRNEELVLICAESNIQENKLNVAVESLNIIRRAYGLSNYEGPITREALIDEMLYERRYSFWGEGQRMYDLRKYGRLNAQFVPIDRAGDQIFTQFPIPQSENQ